MKMKSNACAVCVLLTVIGFVQSQVLATAPPPSPEISSCVKTIPSGQVQPNCDSPDANCYKWEWQDLAGNGIDGPQTCETFIGSKHCYPASLEGDDAIEIHYACDCEEGNCDGNWQETGRYSVKVARRNGDGC